MKKPLRMKKNLTLAVGHAEGWLELRVVVLKIRGVVKSNDGQCGDPAERVDGLQRRVASWSGCRRSR
jgi:hypothetical protein